jgi:hypothetical protein
MHLPRQPRAPADIDAARSGMPFPFTDCLKAMTTKAFIRVQR